MGEQLYFIETEAPIRKGILFGEFGLYWKQRSNYSNPTRLDLLGAFVNAKIERDPKTMTFGLEKDNRLKTAAQQQLTFTLLSAIQEQNAETT